MEWSDKIYSVLAAIITGIVGFFMYERKKTDERFERIETELSQHKSDIAVVQEAVRNIKGDTDEIKESQKVMLDLLTLKRK